MILRVRLHGPGLRTILANPGQLLTTRVDAVIYAYFIHIYLARSEIDQGGKQSQHGSK